MSKASPFNYVNPTITEQSFRELIKDVGMFGTGEVIKTVKAIARQSFGARNLFELSIIDTSVKSRVEFSRPLIGDISECISIPLKARGPIAHIRLLIDDCGDAYVEYRYDSHDYPALQRIKPNQLRKTLAHLMPTSYHPNCPVE